MPFTKTVQTVTGILTFIISFFLPGINPALIAEEQQYFGIVTTPSGKEIPAAYIHNRTSSTWQVTDINGQFQLNENSETGDSLVFSHIGYKPETIILPDNRKYIHVVLIKKNIPLAPVEVTGIQHSGRDIFTDSKTIIKPSGTDEIATPELFKNIPGLNFRRYGGPAGISTMSLDGGNSSNTKVLINDIDFTSAQNGQFDISQIPSPFINNLEVRQESISYFGSGSVDGVIQITPWQDSNKLHFGFGSFGHRSGYVSLTKTFKKNTTNLLTGYLDYLGNFPYQKINDPETLIRRNNYFYQRYFSGNTRQILSKKYFVKLFWLYTDQRRGVTNTIFSGIDTLSNRQDCQTTIALSGKRIAIAGITSVNLIYRKSYEEYHNPYYAINSQHHLYNYVFTLDHNHKILPNLSGNIKVTNKVETIKSPSTGTHQRYNLNTSGILNFTPFHFINFTPVVHYDYAKNSYDIGTWEITTDLTPKWKILDSFRLNYATLFRYPTFNDLYWQPGGNPDLKNERTTAFSGVLDLKITDYINLNFRYYDKKSRNLIQWTPQRSYWAPKNISKTQRSGWHIGGTAHFFDKKLLLSGHFAISRAINTTPGNYYNKRLLYVPKNTAAVKCEFNHQCFSLNLQADHTGKKVVMYDYPDNVVINSITLYSAGINTSIHTKTGTITPALQINNIQDKQYETILGYPEPGRSLLFTITWNFNKEKK